MENCRELFYICLSLIGLVLFLVAMFMNYNLRLDARTVKLEKKNGHEQEQINQLKEEVRKLKEKQNK